MHVGLGQVQFGHLVVLLAAIRVPIPTPPADSPNSYGIEQLCWLLVLVTPVEQNLIVVRMKLAEKIQVVVMLVLIAPMC